MLKVRQALTSLVRKVLEGPAKPGPGSLTWKVQKRRLHRADLTRQRPAGPTAQLTAACGTGSSVARRRALGCRAASPAGFVAFA